MREYYDAYGNRRIEETPTDSGIVNKEENISVKPVYYSQPEAPQKVVAQSRTRGAKDGGGGKGPSRMKRCALAAIAASMCFLSLGVGVGIGQRMPVSAKAMGAESVVAEVQPDTEITGSVTYTPAIYGTSDADVVQVIRNVQNAVVSINVTTTSTDIFNRAYMSTGAGSGIIFSEDSDKIYIATNYHVISNANSATISLDDQTQIAASFVGSDSQSDIAVISVNKRDLSAAGITNYAIASFGDAEAMEVGQTVIAIGNAYGEGKTATLGIISAKNKQITVEDDTALDVLQTDAAINPGNSGGPLVNLNGQVVGINTAKLSESNAEGMGYSIPSNTVKEIVDEIMANGSVQRPYIGIAGQSITEEMKSAYSLPSTGVYVVQVSTINRQPMSNLLAGDVIVAYNGNTVTTMEELQNYIAADTVGAVAKLSVYRGAQLVEVDVTIRNYNKDSNF